MGGAVAEEPVAPQANEVVQELDDEGPGSSSATSEAQGGTEEVGDAEEGLDETTATDSEDDVPGESVAGEEAEPDEGEAGGLEPGEGETGEIGPGGSAEGPGSGSGEEPLPEIWEDPVSVVRPDRFNGYAMMKVGGADRYETSALEALCAFSSSSYAIVTGGTGYADSICSSGLAGALGCPIILTDPLSLQSTTENALRQLGVKHIVLLGGESAVSPQVESQLTELVGSDGSVERLWGEDRYGTQMAVYEYGLRHDLWTGDTIIVANGTGFADALSASPLSYKLKAPVFFVDKTLSFPEDQRIALGQSGKSSFIAVGGTAVMPESVTTLLSEFGSVKRLGGSDRYETSFSIAQYAVSEHGMSWEGTAFTSGLAPYDALGGGSVQGSENSVLCLKDEASSSATSFPWTSKPSYIKFFGGTSVFSNGFKARLSLILGYGMSEVEGLTYTDNGDGWLLIDGKWYYLQGNDFASGWLQLSGTWYYLDPTTRAMQTGWLTVGGKTYYLESSGAMVTGTRWIDGYLRSFDSSGACLKTGYQVKWNNLMLAARNVTLPSYAQGSYWSYVHPCTISADATRSQVIEAFIDAAYDYQRAGTRWVDNQCGAPGTTVDCSGLVMESLYAVGMDLTGAAGGDYNPYTKYYQNHHFANTWRNSQTFQPISFSELERGDIVYYSGHVAIYLGNGRILESTPYASNVREASVYSPGTILGCARPFTK
ncbi:cell wall-binding repeat-containing protein [Olsenella profusa]|uniref:Cell wall-binding repeat-containing protein n=1 Tax=Olsenella profusa TaxID=138595 RepID=A0ABS2F1F1_9ACTN|nr:cell wall-binding repeat-containing protein [Olsenella profusa]MBM6774801.1 cell wall-binding repeat-containing protein [Olsenella profusa]